MDTTTDHDVVIIGSGFSGLGTAIRLRQEGMEDFVVLERGKDVGGTWHYNTYPGCACDVPSHLYSFSFAPNPDWTETYSPQPEIRSYLEGCADRFGVRPFIRFGTTVTESRWDEEDNRWVVETDRGTYRARVLVSAAGPLTEPKIPEIDGLDDFRGGVWHSARWDHDFDLEGKRVASIGTGASAIQYVPAIQPEVEHVTVFQRTPPWVMPHPNRRTTKLERRVYRTVPALQKLVRGAVYASRESFVLGFVKNPRLMKIGDTIARQHMRRQIRDPELLEKVMPGYTMGCKRILPSNKWYPALQEPNVDLVAGGVDRVTPTGVVGSDGVERPVDAIVFGTGFHVTDMPIANAIRGRRGAKLIETFQANGMKAYAGASVPGFPNLFLLMGPNTGLGHTSMVYMIESQIAHVMAALREMRARRADVVEVRADAVERYNETLEQKIDGSVWNTGCASWYLDDTGRNATQWPDWTFRFRQQASRFDTADYRLETAPQREAVAA